MGNKNSKVSDDIYNDAEIEKAFKWSKSNTKLNTVHKTFGKIYACDSKRIRNGKTDAVLFASADQGGTAMVTNISLSKDRKGKIQTTYKGIDKISLRSAWVMALAISPSTRYIACGGLDNLVSIYAKGTNSDSNSYGLYCELQGHQGYVSCIKFIEDGYNKENLVLSVSGDGSVILWDINNRSQLLQIADVANCDIEYIDHVYTENKHIIAFCDISSIFHIRDITKTINDMNDKLENDDDTENDDEKKEEQDKCMKDEKDTLFFDQDLGQFTTDVNSVAFSPNGMFLAATSDDGTYEIYQKNIKYDSFWDTNVLEWTFLCQRDFQIIDENYSSGTVVNWIDNETLMVGCDETNKLYSTYMKMKKNDPNTIKAVMEGTEIMIESLPNMNWIGLCKTITNEILQYLNEFDIFDYQYKFLKNTATTRVSCITSCKWSKESYDEDQYIMIFGCWDKKARAVIPNLL